MSSIASIDAKIKINNYLTNEINKNLLSVRDKLNKINEIEKTTEMKYTRDNYNRYIDSLKDTKLKQIKALNNIVSHLEINTSDSDSKREDLHNINKQISNLLNEIKELS